MVNIDEFHPMTEYGQWFSVRIAYTHRSTGKTFERITLWQARTPEEALSHARDEADRYCARETGSVEGFQRSEPEIVLDVDEAVEMRGRAQYRVAEESHSGE